MATSSRAWRRVNCCRLPAMAMAPGPSKLRARSAPESAPVAAPRTTVRAVRCPARAPVGASSTGTSTSPQAATPSTPRRFSAASPSLRAAPRSARPTTTQFLTGSTPPASPGSTTPPAHAPTPTSSTGMQPTRHRRRSARPTASATSRPCARLLRSRSATESGSTPTATASRIPTNSRSLVSPSGFPTARRPPPTPTACGASRSPRRRR